MGNKIEHKGIVESIDGEHLKVRILQSSACSECHAKSLCSSSDSKEKLIDIFTPQSNKYKIGEEVKICGSVTMGRNAVLLAFGFPLLLIILWVTISTIFIKLDEGSTIVGIAILLSVYYLILKALNSRISKNFSFWIES